MLVWLKFLDNDLLVVVDSVLAGNTSYLDNEVPISQDSHYDTEIDAFESTHVGIPIGTPGYRIIHIFQVHCI